MQPNQTGQAVIKTERPVLAFTVIELLVVISIIALLIAILLPTVQRAKRQGLVIRCAANLKSLALGSTAYATEDAAGEYWVNDIKAWNGPVTVWAGAGAFLDANPNKKSALHTFTDIICGGDRTILWCPVDDSLYNPLNEVRRPACSTPTGRCFGTTVASAMRSS